MLEDLSDRDRRILHAAMASMILDTHLCEDKLTDEEWARAQQLFSELTSLVDEESDYRCYNGNHPRDPDGYCTVDGARAG